MGGLRKALRGKKKSDGVTAEQAIDRPAPVKEVPDDRALNRYRRRRGELNRSRTAQAGSRDTFLSTKLG